MRNEKLNGKTIPYDLPFDELEKMLFSDDMTDFCLACEAFCERDDDKSYQLIKGFLNHRDRYRRLYAVKTVFRYSKSVELLPVIEDLLTDKDLIFAHIACRIIAEKEFKVSESKLRSAVTSIKRDMPGLYSSDVLCALKMLSESEENYGFLVDLFNKSPRSLEKTVLAEIMTDKYVIDKSKELFQLFCSSVYPAIRMLAVEIGKKLGFDLSEFLKDSDGHIRKAVNRAETKEQK